VNQVLDDRPATLTDYLAVLRRRKLIIIVIPLVAALVAYEIAKGQPAVYRAQATVLVNRSAGAVTAILSIQDPTAVGDSERFLATQADIARSSVLAQRVVEAAGVQGVTAGDLLGSSSVSPKPNADVLEMSVSSRHGRDAVLLANAYARQFTRYKTELDTARINDALGALRDRIRVLEDNGQAATAAYQTLVQYQGELELAGKLVANSMSVLEPADGASQTEPRPRRNLILAGLLGGVIALGLAFLIDALDRRVRSEEDIEQALGAPLLGRIARPPRRLQRRQELVMLADAGGAAAETYRKLRATIEFISLQREETERTIMFTSAVQREGKSTTIANLAVAFARAGRRVALVDADVRRSFLHSFFGVDSEPGLADVAVGRTSLASAMRRVDVPLAPGLAPTDGTNGGPVKSLGLPNDGSDHGATMHFLPSGTMPAAAGEFLASDAVSSVVAGLRDQFDVVLVDAPPLTVVGDAKTLSRAVDAIIVVTALAMKRPLLDELTRELHNCRAPTLGFIVTGVPGGELYPSRYGYQAYLQRPHAERSERPL
jgi:Mrp family chromosome partitioning ATPase/capsular polysaccharide biosynthesis protein